MRGFILTLYLVCCIFFSGHAQTMTDWEVLREAIIWVESRGHEDAVNGDCVGVLQIRPIYVAEVNRILKEERYTVEDRYDRGKSIEMFEILQAHHNPTRNHDRAIRLHNPTETTGDYSRKIKTKYNEIKQSN